MPLAKLSETPSGADATDRILAAAKDLFAESGFDAVSVNAIAERAGVSKANIFHHFKSKNELYLAVLKMACSESRDQIDQFGSNESPFVDRLRNYLQSHLAGILRDERFTSLILRDLLESGPQRGKELAEQVFGQSFARMVEILRTGQSNGALRSDVDPAMVATLLTGADVFFFQSREILRHFPDVTFTETPARYSEMLADILLRGILPPGENP